MLINGFLGTLGLLGALFSVSSGIVDISNYANDHPWGYLKVGSDEWRQACKHYFPNSFDPDTGDWFDGKQWRPCIIKKVRHR